MHLKFFSRGERTSRPDIDDDILMKGIPAGMRGIGGVAVEGSGTPVIEYDEFTADGQDPEWRAFLSGSLKRARAVDDAGRSDMPIPGTE